MVPKIFNCYYSTNNICTYVHVYYLRTSPSIQNPRTNLAETTINPPLKTFPNWAATKHAFRTSKAIIWTGSQCGNMHSSRLLINGREIRHDISYGALMSCRSWSGSWTLTLLYSQTFQKRQWNYLTIKLTRIARPSIIQKVCVLQNVDL